MESITTSAELCREQGWVAGDLLCCADSQSTGRARFVRLTAVGEKLVLGRPVSGNGTEGAEEVVELLPESWKRLTLREWQSLQDTHTS